MSETAQSFRALLDGPGLVVVPECYSVLTGRIVERAGFPAAYCGGSALGGMHLGIPDYGLITTTELIDLSGRIAAGLSIPLIVDADLGGETSLTVRRSVQDFERAGVAAVHIEDSVTPKHLNIHSETRSAGEAVEPLQPLEEMCARLAAAADARDDERFAIIARTDTLFNGRSVEEAIERGRAYAAAGADVFMCLRTPAEEIDRLAAAVPIPLLDINHPLAAVAGTRLKLDVFTGYAVPAAVEAQERWIEHLKAHGAYQDLGDGLTGRLPRGMHGEAYGQLIGAPAYLQEAERWLASRPPTRGEGDERAA